MRIAGLILGVSTLVFTSTVVAADSYSVQTVPGPKNARSGMYAVEIYRENDAWKMHSLRGGLSYTNSLNSNERIQELAGGRPEKAQTGEILIIDPKNKKIFLGAPPPEARNQSVAENSTSKTANATFECFIGFGSTSRRSQGYNICSSELTSYRVNPAQAIFSNIFNIIFFTLSTRKQVDADGVLFAANQSGAISAAEDEFDKAYHFLKMEAAKIVKNKSGTISKDHIDYFERVYEGNNDSDVVRGLIEEAELISKEQANARYKEWRLKEYRNKYSRLNENAPTAAEHHVFLVTYEGYDPDNVQPMVRLQMERIKERVKKNMTIIGNRICMDDGRYNVVGFIENTSGEKLQIRVADIQQIVMKENMSISRLTYKGIPLERSSIFWDNYQGWQQC